MKPVFCFGEIMARFSPPGHLRLRQAMPGALETTFAGAEVNAAAAIAALGGRAEFVTALPRNELADACLAAVRAAGVGTNHVLARAEGRLGLYFVETGANQRGGLVLYDREHSTFALTGAEAYAWPERLAGAGWFHVSGISASVSRAAAEATLAAARAARAAGVTVSCDLNYRRKLWRWEPATAPADLARRVMGELLAEVDVVIGNAADLAAAAGLPAPAETGAPDPDAVRQLVRDFLALFPRVGRVAVTLREGVSASHNRWGALLVHAGDGATFLAPTVDGRYRPYDIEQIVDRVGTGDAFAGALIHAFLTPELAAPETALRFAVAASCLAHSIRGDFAFCSRAEVEALLAGGTGGAVSR
jgi:2-dehydro-3-deoxygluconokinase